MRSAKNESCFPYSAKTVCYIEVLKNGDVRQIYNSKSEIETACLRAKNKESTIYAVWPGKYRSDLFIIDDLDALADAYGIDRDKGHLHEVVWRLNKNDDEKSSYASIDLEFCCGCCIGFDNIRLIANDFKKQYGWDMATSRGFSIGADGTKTVYTVPIRRSTLKK